MGEFSAKPCQLRGNDSILGNFPAIDMLEAAKLTGL
jgi:hypothetical protein